MGKGLISSFSYFPENLGAKIDQPLSIFEQVEFLKGNLTTCFQQLERL